MSAPTLKVSVGNKSLLRLSLAAAASSAALLVAGCANMVTTASQTNSFAQGTTITGHVHGGNQPVTGATVRLYAAGTTGYGSAGTLFATTTTANDAFGSFSFTKLATNTNNLTPTTPVYGCPTSGDPQMYLVAMGGATQGTGNGDNSAAAFIAAIGKCSTVSAATFVDLTEVTTVATMAALQQYFSPVTDSFGYPNTTQAAVGFANGVSTIANLADISTGAVNQGSSRTATPAGTTTPVRVDILPEYAKLNTIANIIAACVNTTSGTSGNCTTLFANATPQNNIYTSQPTIAYPPLTTDVLQATYYMFTNPTSGGAAQINTLFALPPAASPFQPTLASAPTDWTLAIRYSSTSPCSYGTFLAAPYFLVSDANGNIWVSSGGALTTSSNLLEVTPNGAPATCALGASVALTKGLTIDIAGNVWISSQGTAAAPYYKYNIATGTFTTWPTPTAAVPYNVAADAQGNIFFTSTNSRVFEFVNGANSAAPTTALPVGVITGSPFYVAVDTFGRVFVDQAQTTSLIYDIYPSTASGNLNGYLTAQVGNTTQVSNPYAVMAGLNSVIWNANSINGTVGANTVYQFTPDPANPGTVTYSASSATFAGGIIGARGNGAVDGAGNAWFAGSSTTTGNYVTGATTGTNYAISEFGANLTPLSPSSTLTTADNGGFQKDLTIITTGGARGVAIDPTGNVWVGANTTAGNGIVELVGAAVPVVTPVAAALLAGFNTGNAVQKP